jgi:hypothetical protein
MRHLTTLKFEVYGMTFDVYVTFGGSRKTFQVKTAHGFKTIAKKDCTGKDNCNEILEAWKAARA